jgi:hypothetical protein
MAQLPTHDTLPASSQDALEMFDERYLAQRMLQQPSTWAETLGEIINTPSTSTKYPMAFLALKYLETIAAEGRFRTIGEKDCELQVVEYDDGVEIELLKLLTNTFSARRWMDAPAGMLQAERVFRNKSIATMLEANTATCGWDDLVLFHDTHRANPKDVSVGTFDNNQASAKDVVNLDNIAAEIALMQLVKDENGDKLNVNPDAVGVPTEKFQALKNLLKQDFVPSTAGTATIRNPYSDGTLLIVHMPELTDANDWYLFDTKLIAKGAAPWVGAKLQIDKPGFDALGLRRFGEESDRFKLTGKIAVSSHIWWGFKFLYPHGIRKVAGA